MNLQKRLYTLFIWWAVIGFSIWLGGTIFNISVIEPMWSESPPDSVRMFFGETTFNTYIYNFFGPPWMLLRNLPLLIVLLLAWQSKPHRFNLIIATGCLLFGIAFTLIYVYPINDVLILKAGADKSAAEIQRLVDQWIFADRLRLVVMLVGYLFLLRTFRMPAPEFKK